jgi:hypothetical protein
VETSLLRGHGRRGDGQLGFVCFHLDNAKGHGVAPLAEREILTQSLAMKA